MTVWKNLTESECIDLIKYISDVLAFKKAETAIAAIVERIRDSFGVSCVSVREVFSRPFSLRYIYESLNDPTKVKRINETVTFEEDVWQGALKKFSEGCYIYRSGGEQSEPQFIGPVPNEPKCMIQIPLYRGYDFHGVLDLVDFEKIRDWSELEISSLKICASLICHYLYNNSSSMFYKNNSGNDTDPLTGLMTFNTFTDQLDEKLPKMLRESPVAVVYIDIHHFKYINETYGYKKGDELLKLAAQAIYDGITKYAEIMMCRAYADNFVTAANVPEEVVPIFDSFVHGENEKICEILQNSCPDVRIRIDTGICYVRTQDITAATAIANANLARKRAKREHMLRPNVFSNEMMEEIKYQEYLSNELPKAIENHDLKVYFQPKINCSDDSLYGAEALVRWQKPDGTFIYPDQFIPLFEKNGNIVDVDFYVYREVFRYIRGRLDMGLPVFPISMNVSRVHLHSDRIVSYIKELREEYRIPTELLEFELTENIYMENFSKAEEMVRAFRSQGMKISMDDFGSGYSSLNVITSIGIDTLKIDRVFLKNEELTDSDKVVMESIITMAKRLGMNVICEGVETESQVKFLKDSGCDYIQGYYYGKPMDEATFNKFIVANLISL